MENKEEVVDAEIVDVTEKETKSPENQEDVKKDGISLDDFKKGFNDKSIDEEIEEDFDVEKKDELTTQETVGDEKNTVAFEDIKGSDTSDSLASFAVGTVDFVVDTIFVNTTFKDLEEEDYEDFEAFTSRERKKMEEVTSRLIAYYGIEKYIPPAIHAAIIFGECIKNSRSRAKALRKEVLKNKLLEERQMLLIEQNNNLIRKIQEMQNISTEQAKEIVNQTLNNNTQEAYISKGRPRKYATEEERKLAKRIQDRESRKRKASKI